MFDVGNFTQADAPVGPETDAETLVHIVYSILGKAGMTLGGRGGQNIQNGATILYQIAEAGYGGLLGANLRSFVPDLEALKHLLSVYESKPEVESELRALLQKLFEIVHDTGPQIERERAKLG